MASGKGNNRLGDIGREIMSSLGEGLQTGDFSGLNQEGTYTIRTDDGTMSRPFVIGSTKTYSAMMYDALNGLKSYPLARQDRKELL